MADVRPHVADSRGAHRDARSWMVAAGL